MQYIIASKQKAILAGFSLVGHHTHNEKILLNGKEVMDSAMLSGTAAERAKQIDGELYSETKVYQIIKQEGWK